jgi:sugar-specific transcriptional regulator TrmB
MEDLHHLLDHLRAAGLSDREAKVYLVVLSSGGASVQAISQLAKLPRTTVYELLGSLIELQLVEQTLSEEGKGHYRAHSPDRLVLLVRHRAEELEGHIRRLERALPEFLALERRESERPYVTVFEGEEGMWEVSARFEEMGGDFWEIVPFDVVSKFIRHEAFEEHRERLVRAQAHGKVLVVADRPPLEVMRDIYERYGWESRFLPATDVPLIGHVSVKGDTLYSFSYGTRPISMVVENAAIAEALRRVFTLAWEAAPRDFRFPNGVTT